MEKGRLIIDGVDVSGSVGSAASVPYSNTNSGLEATNTQGAIDELATSVTELNSKIDSIIKNTVEFLQGEATISQVYPGSTDSLLVQFEKPFSGIPVVLCSILYKTEQSGPHVGNIESISDITQSGLIVNIKNTGMTYARNYTFNWTANIDTSNT